LTLASTQTLPSTFAKYTSTSTKKCVAEGNVSSSSVISIDASSITTLVGSNYTVDISPREKPARALPNVDKKEWRLFRIDGTMVNGVYHKGKGVYIKSIKGSVSEKAVRVAVYSN
jgi:hypothetical protein